MTFDCNLVNPVSSKSGKPYYAIDIVITPDYTKRVLLDRAELALVKSLKPNS